MLAHKPAKLPKVVHLANNVYVAACHGNIQRESADQTRAVRLQLVQYRVPLQHQVHGPLDWATRL
jgi:hypothetical protein